MIVAVTEQGEDVRLPDLPGKTGPFSCPGCGCEVVPAALSSHKVRPYFRAVTHHAASCSYAAIVIDPEQEAAANTLDFQKVWHRMFPGNDGVSRFAEPHPLSTRVSPNVALAEDYFSDALRLLYQKCQSSDYRTLVGKDPIRDIYCGRETAHIYTTYISGKKLVECSFIRFDKEKRSIYFGFPYGAERKITIRAIFSDTSLLNDTISRVFRHKGVILLFSDFKTASDGYVRTQIQSKHQIVGI